MTGSCVFSSAFRSADRLLYRSLFKSSTHRLPKGSLFRSSTKSSGSSGPTDPERSFPEEN